ncbi:MAG: UDP-N-acetylmuramoyl-L-alanyl-D-glutamate--2,6-diaminopimelate ligase [Armatimonadota bacterium]
MVRPEPKNLNTLLDGLEHTFTSGGDVRIIAVTADSRDVHPGSLFVAIEGYETDGHAYIADALENGAVAVVYENATFSDHIPDDISGVTVPDSRRAAALIADRFWDHPSGELQIAAVTGTNGKTTCVHLLDSIFRAAGHKTGTIGTLGWTIGDESYPGDRTTPDAVELQKIFAEMTERGATHAAMEVTSHALDLDRTYGTTFAAAVFTNLSQDHLDWHQTMVDYFASKMVLFTDYTRFAPDMVGAVNIDDAWGVQVAEDAECSVTTYGMKKKADVSATGVCLSPDSTTFTLHTPAGSTETHLQLVGLFNVYNALSAAACCHAMGFSLQELAGGLSSAPPVPGRLEQVRAGQDFTVLVDYAHTPEALKNVLEVCRTLNPTRLICVFGCGGDRDTSKRPKMGNIATKLSDITIITSDNPRSEDPADIIAHIEMGARASEYEVEVDRRAAIEKACQIAKSGDIVLIAGKGHETYQEFADGRIDFDDREVARKALQQL